MVKTRKWGNMKKKILILLAVMLVVLAYIVITSFVLSADIGYLVGDPFYGVSIPTDETLIKAFADTEINWEIAYWSAMISEFTYGKYAYPSENRALTALGFTTTRVYSFFEHEGELKDNLMADAGIREIVAPDGSSYTLVAIAFRGSVPLVLDSVTTHENMRRNLDIRSQAWREDMPRVTVHRGFKDQYNDVIRYILSEINEEFGLSILRNAGHRDSSLKFWITGHSLGGALAELLTLDLIENGVEPERVMAYGFATPLVGSRRLHEFAQSRGASDRIFNIFHRQDMVAHMGYGLIFGRSLAADENIMVFGNRGIWNRSHHGLPRIYLPFVISQNDYPLRQQFETSLIVADIVGD